MRFESKKGSNEKNMFLNMKKHIFFTALSWLVLWLCNSKMICPLALQFIDDLSFGFAIHR
jgi:hypothetical protein